MLTHLRGSLLAGLFILSASAATAQEVRTPCPAGAGPYAIQYGGYFECSLTTQITHRWDFDAVSGEFVGLQLIRLAGSGLPCITIENPSGVIVFIQLCDTVLTVPRTRNALQIATTGKYRINVYESGTIFSSYQYSLNLERLAPPTATAPLFEPGQVVTGAINPAGDRDLYRFRVQAGDQYKFILTKLAGVGEAFMDVLDTLAAPVALSSGVTRIASVTGTLGLWVKDQGDNETYEYRLEFVCATCPATLVEIPSAPSPADGAVGVSRNVTLSWTENQAVDSMDVYFGTTNPPPFVTNTTAKTYTPVTLNSGTTYYWKIVAKVGAATGASSVFSFTTIQNIVLTGGRMFVPVPPCRLVDTREASLDAFGTPALAGGAIRAFAVPQRAACGIPANASAYSLNVTVVPLGPLGYLTIFPTGSVQPLVSTLNSLDARVKANAAIVPAGVNGAVSVFVTNATELILDINGYFIDPFLNSQALAFYPLPPCRVIDTRNANGLLGGPGLGAGVGRDIPVISSNCGVPSNAAAYSLNATVVPSSPLGYLTLWPTGQAQPFVSTLNAPTGGVVANAAIVPAGTNGSISAFASSATQLILDINGYFATPGAANGQRFFTVAPCRLLDTRDPVGEFGGPVLTGGATRSYRLPLANCGLAGSSAAYSVNATVVPAASLGYLTLWPAGSAQPLVSTLNAPDGSITSNAALVPAGTEGGVSSFVTGQTHLILDTNGFFAP